MSKGVPVPTFVPFEPAADRPIGPEPGPRLKVVPKPDAPPSFTPLPEMSGGSAVPPPPPSAHAQAQAHARHANYGAPTVTLQREGDRVVGIRVECGCGQVIELSCAYGDTLAP